MGFSDATTRRSLEVTRFPCSLVDAALCTAAARNTLERPLQQLDDGLSVLISRRMEGEAVKTGT